MAAVATVCTGLFGWLRFRDEQKLAAYPAHIAELKAEAVVLHKRLAECEASHEVSLAVSHRLEVELAVLRDRFDRYVVNGGVA